MSTKLEDSLSVLVNKLSKATKMLTHYGLAQPGEYGETAESIEAGRLRWGAQRDAVIGRIRELYPNYSCGRADS